MVPVGKKMGLCVFKSAYVFVCVRARVFVCKCTSGQRCGPQ